MKVSRDENDQPMGEWSDRDHDLLTILEEVSSEAIKPDRSLMAYVADITDVIFKYDQAYLGLATTRELLEEVSARMHISQNSHKGTELGDLCDQALTNLTRGVLDYRTVQ